MLLSVVDKNTGWLNQQEFEVHKHSSIYVEEIKGATSDADGCQICRSASLQLLLLIQ